MARKKLAVLISGRGSNLQSLIDAARSPDYPAQIALVISNRPGAPGLEHARRAGISTVTIDHETFGKGAAGKSKFEAELSDTLAQSEPDFVCLAGFMRMLSPDFVARYDGRLLNIHPSLLPAFKGLNTHEAMIAAGVRIAGCTVHFVTADTDAGPIVDQAAVPVHSDDTAQSLAARILAEEHKLYPACVRLLCEGQAQLIDGRVLLHKNAEEKPSNPA
ncbi:MAG: phosphoribosylglycinamide formyltransferase [Parvularculaceae bacterium]